MTSSAPSPSKTTGNRIKWTILAIVLVCLVLLFPTCAGSCGTNVKNDIETSPTSVDQSANTETASTLECTAYKINDGNVILSLTASQLLDTFASGDILSVTFDGHVIDMPLVTTYSSIDPGMSALVVRASKDVCLLATSMGDFTKTYGVTEGTSFAISLKKAGGYLEDLRMRDLSYTDERSDFSNLSDTEFANFRVVDTTGMGEGILYRGVSPIDSMHNRNTYADAALKDAGVKTIINLSNNEDEVVAFPGYADTYYASVSHIELDMGYDFAGTDFQEKLARGLRFLVDNESPYYIHCLEGKDRTGFVIAMLECLMGASYDEVIADYMTTFANYYGIEPNNPRYEYHAQHSIVLSLKRAFVVEDLTTTDLASKAEEYLKGIGLTQDEMAALKSKLSGALPAAN